MIYFKLLKKQGFYRGVKGGYEAGIYGSRVCGDLMRANKKLYRKEIRKLKRQFKKEVKIIEEKYKGRKKAVFKDYVREKRRVEEVIRRKERIRLHPNYALLRQEKRMMLREIKKNYFGEINEVNDLIEQEVLKLSDDQELKNLISKQKRDVRAVDLSRSY